MSAATTELLRSAYLVNLTNPSGTLRSLQLLAGYSDRDAARVLCVSPHTYRRWRRDRSPNPTAVRLLAIHAGYVPWPNWRGWEIHSGLLFPPGFVRGGLTPGQVEGLPWILSLQRQMVRERSTSATEAPAVLDLSGRREAS